MSDFFFCDHGRVNISSSPDDPGRRLGIGIYYVTVGVIGIPICLFNLRVFCKKQYIQQSCYKFLAISICLDIANLFNSAFMPGILSLSNMTPCNGHVWTYYFAKQHIVFWFAYTATSEVLALNRMMIFASKHMSQILYDGNRSWLWITAIIAYTAGMFSIDPAAQFVYDPDFGAIFDATTNLVHVANNFSKLGIVSVLYILMLVFMFKQTRTAGKKVDKGQIKISLVTLTIAALADFASAAYVGASYLPKDTTLGKNSGIIGETCWFMLHSGTAFICMFCNNAVLEELKKLLGVQKKPKKSDATITAITVLAAMKSTHSNSRNSQDSNQSITRVNNFVK